YFYVTTATRELPSFPTRRSSDLLNTIKAVIRRDSEQASQLVQYLSTFFRKNLKRPSEFVTLADEIEHVNAYLQIEKARFQSRLRSEEHTSELQSRFDLVCRLLLE